jgi:hypothetical protein
MSAGRRNHPRGSSWPKEDPRIEFPDQRFNGPASLKRDVASMKRVLVADMNRVAVYIYL